MKYLFSVLLFSLSFISIAQDQLVDLSYYLPNDVSYDSSIPTPKSVIGHEVGEWHVSHDKIVQYMYALDKASDRIKIEDRGKTFEGRPLLLLTITSPTNHKNIDQIQKDHLSLIEPNSGSMDTSDMPIVIYQGYSIHGNEPSGTNAALAIAYYLAAGKGEKINELLDKAVILFDPSYNPDGLQRFAYWANTNRSKNINPDPNDREYDEVWPGGRTNHYWFDMNRDWLPVQLPESRARIKTFHSWYPNVLTDHHEMGTNSSFFFQPGIPSRTHPLTPQKNQDLTGEIAKYHAKALDKIGSLYYSEESFDDFYYGKGSTFPDINGGIGILFEQASSRGHAQESNNGILTFPFTIRNQVTAAMSTMEASVKLRKKILDYQKKFFSDAHKESAKGGAIVFGDQKDASNVYHLAEVLQRHKIKFHEVTKDFSANGKTYKKGSSFIIPKKQRQYRLLQALFEKRTKFQDSLFYDISAWTFPLAFGLDYDENVTLSHAGNKIDQLSRSKATVPTNSNYAYLMEWHDYYSPKALNILLESGLRVKVGMKQFSLESHNYDYGTILIPVQNQEMKATEIYSLIKKVASETNIKIRSVNTGLADGIDLGSGNFRTLKQPKVALLVGEGINGYDAGEIWHVFDQRYDMLITKLDTKNFSRTDLSRYTDIIMPSNWGNGLDKDDADKLRSWVSAGGSLIAYRNAGKWLNKNELLKMEFITKKDTAKNVTFEQRRNYSGAKYIGGAIFEAQIDRSHPIAFGYSKNKISLFRNTTLFLKEDVNSYNNPIRYTDKPLLSGYISESNLERLKNTAAFKVGKIGKGRIIYFTDNTNFRAFWYGTNKLLMNAIFFGNAM